MPYRQIPVLFILLLASLCSSAQQLLTGHIFDQSTDSLLPAVSILNITSQQQQKARDDGSYAIQASEGDLVIFSSAGYQSDTLKVMFHMFATGIDISLKPHHKMLSTVYVREPDYQLDSIERRNEYSRFYAKTPTRLAGGNTPEGGFGISFSPLSYFSHSGKQERRLRKRLKYNEEQAYVDYCFPQDLVARQTGLKSDSLQLFMLRFRPSYDFCRKSNRDGMIIYIKNRLKEFLHKSVH